MEIVILKTTTIWKAVILIIVKLMYLAMMVFKYSLEFSFNFASVIQNQLFEVLLSEILLLSLVKCQQKKYFLLTCHWENVIQVHWF